MPRVMEGHGLRTQAISAALVPPQAIDAEQAVLGGLMLDNSAWDRIVDVVHEAHFYRTDHRLIFRHIAHLIENNKRADVLTVCESLGRQVHEVGGQVYVGELSLQTPSAAGARDYAKIVRDRALQRQVITVCTETMEAAYRAAPGDAAGLIDDLDAKLFALRQRKGRGSRMLVDVLTEVVEEIDTQYSREDKNAITGLPSGFADLDKMTAGFQGGDLIIVAARPSMGKTAIAMNFAEWATVHERKSVAVFSLEMSDRQLTRRMLGSVGRLDQHALRTGMFPEEAWPKITETVGRLSEARIVIEEPFDLTPGILRARARHLKREHPDLALIIVDYLQLMGGGGERRVDQIAEISRGLKRIAMELNIPVVALSQLNRSLENRPNKRPQMSDLRESGALEQDADLILFLYRDEVYDPESAARGTAELIVGKHRNGPTGTVRLAFLPRFTRFENFAGEEPFVPPPKRNARVANFEDFKANAAGDR